MIGQIGTAQEPSDIAPISSALTLYITIIRMTEMILHSNNIVLRGSVLLFLPGIRLDEFRAWPCPALGERGHDLARHGGQRRHKRVRGSAMESDDVRAGQRRVTHRPEGQ